MRDHFIAVIFSLIIVFGLSGCAPLLFAGAVVTTVDLAHDRRSVGEYLDDTSIELAAQTQLAKLRGEENEVSVKAVSWNGILLLTGEVDSLVAQQQMTQRLAELRGVRQVVDETSIADASKFKDRSKDVWISTKLKAKLFSSLGLDGNRVKVITRNRIVYLMGIVTEAEAEQVTEVARSVRGVEKVVRVFEYTES